eukprot:356952-Chlamydomonas_euryale.AAC.2
MLHACAHACDAPGKHKPSQVASKRSSRQPDAYRARHARGPVPSACPPRKSAASGASEVRPPNTQVRPCSLAVAKLEMAAGHSSSVQTVCLKPNAAAAVALVPLCELSPSPRHPPPGHQKLPIRTAARSPLPADFLPNLPFPCARPVALDELVGGNFQPDDVSTKQDKPACEECHGCTTNLTTLVKSGFKDIFGRKVRLGASRTSFWAQGAA